MKKIFLVLSLLISSQSYATNWDSVFIVYKWEVQGVTYFTNDIKRVPSAYIKTAELHLVDGTKKLTLVSKDEKGKDLCPSQ